MMETGAALCFQSCTLIDFDKTGRNPRGSLRFSQRWSERRSLQKFNSVDLRFRNGSGNPRITPLELSCSFKNNPSEVYFPRGHVLWRIVDRFGDLPVDIKDAAS